MCVRVCTCLQQGDTSPPSYPNHHHRRHHQRQQRTLAEAAVGERVALLLASWRSNYHALQQLALHVPHTGALTCGPKGETEVSSTAALEEEARGALKRIHVCIVGVEESEWGHACMCALWTCRASWFGWARLVGLWSCYAHLCTHHSPQFTDPEEEEMADNASPTGAEGGGASPSSSSPGGSSQNEEEAEEEEDPLQSLACTVQELRIAAYVIFCYSLLWWLAVLRLGCVCGDAYASCSLLWWLSVLLW